jgi:hypothetical protein
MLGYEGQHSRQQAHDLETGRRPIMPCQARLAVAYRDGYRPRDWPTGEGEGGLDEEGI